MTWRHLLFLAAGFAAGLLVGLSQSGSPELRAPARRIEAAGQMSAPLRGEQPPAEVERESVPKEVREAGPPGVPPIEPQGRVPAGPDVSEDCGIIEVDFRGVDCDPEFSVGVRHLSGERDEIEGYVDERDSRIARAELPPGTHVVSWQLSGWQGRVGVRVRVTTGHVTRVDAAASSGIFELPVSPGLNRLEVTVRGLRGEPLPGVLFTVEGATSAGWGVVDGQTDEYGRCRLEILPGARTIEVGAHRVGIQLIEGETTRIEIEPAGQGMLVFEPLGLGSNVWVEPVADEFEWVDSRFRFAEGGTIRHGVAYLAPGEYRMTCGRSFMGGRRLGRVSIRPGQTTRVRLSVGHITCHISTPDARRNVPLRDIRAYAAILSPSNQEERGRLPSLSKGSLNLPGRPDSRALLGIPYVPPGRYQVWAEAEKFRSEKVIADVHENSVEVHLVLLPSAR